MRQTDNMEDEERQLIDITSGTHRIHKHRLYQISFQTFYDKSMNDWICDTCRKMQINKKAWHCFICRCSFCDACLKPIYNHQHILVQTDYKTLYQGCWRCNRCNRHSINSKSKFPYHCIRCTEEFDLCYECVSSCYNIEDKPVDLKSYCMVERDILDGSKNNQEDDDLVEQTKISFTV